MTARTAGEWRRIANDRLRTLWIAAQANGGTLRVSPAIEAQYPGEETAEVWMHVDQTGDLVIEAHHRRER